MTSSTDDLRQLGGDSTLVLVGRIGTIGGGFLAHTLLIRELDPEIFGVLSLGLTIVTVCAGLAVVGLDQAAARFISIGGADDADDYVSITSFGTVVSATVLTLLVYIFREKIEVVFESPGLQKILQILAILVILRSAAKVILGVVQGFERTRSKVLYHDLLPLFTSLVILGYFVAVNQPLIGAFAFYLSRPIVQTLLLSLDFRRWSGWNIGISRPSSETVREVFSFSWPLAFERIVTTFLSSVDILMLGFFIASTDVGLYRSIQPVAATLVIFLQVLTFIYLPLASKAFANDDIQHLSKLYSSSTRLVSHATFPLLMFFLLFGEDFIAVVFGPEYTPAWIALSILSLGTYSRVIAGPNGMTIKAIDRTREDLIASVGALATNIGLNYLLIEPFGIAGAAAATGLSYLVYNLLDLWVIYRYTGLMPFGFDLFLPIFPTVLICFTIQHVVSYSPTSLPELLMIGFTITFIHLGSVFVTTGITEEDKLLLGGFLNW